ncbi:histidine phosphatase family protein [Paraburkholderia sp. 1N]|uniref:Histidine phosphatase family protein n=1 Tax=Paraburkholderia solitsugae TaxID=2675748 RepID=A0ABX2BPX8_9BURK|nr:histidine phosphatase family protein [Paraburkholderia solitsugae]NPT42123.1 histidine phosphatase family protein [Paraburkholderia solitsugae]
MSLLRVLSFRHGESAANAGHATSDPASIPLTETGEEQARAISQRLAEPPAVVICSPFRRAQRTAAPTLTKFPTVPSEIWSVQEFTYLAPARCVGTSAEQRRSWVDAYWDASNPTLVDGPGAESFAAFIGRVRTALDCFRLLHGASDVTVAMFGHGQFLQAMRWLILNGIEVIDADAMRSFRIVDQHCPIRNADGFVATFDGRSWTVEQKYTALNNYRFR